MSCPAFSKKPICTSRAKLRDGVNTSVELDLNRLILGDCLEVLKTFPDNFFDSCVSDVPYGLGTKEPTPEEIISYLREGDMGRLRQGKKNCANSILRAAIVPESDDLDTKVRDQVVPFKVRMHQPAVMMGGIVKFDDQSILGKEEIHSVGSVFEFEDLLVDDFNVVSLEEVQDRKFSLRERETFSGCVEMCRCFTSIGSSLFRMVVGFVDNSFGQTPGSPSVMTFGATEIRAVLTLDVARRTGELTFTSGTDDLNSLLLLPATENVGAFSGTGGLSSLVQSFFSGEIRLPTDRTIPLCVEVPTSLLDRFHSPLESHKDFMGKDWSIPSVNVWKEVYRVLKPGGHVLAFAGTRTWDLISLGLRSAGFEKRDTIADNHPALQWVYASGMPKSTNVGKAIAKLEEATDEQKKSTQGLGSGLKPSWEPILVFRKPFKGSLTKNVLTYGTGALNIDATRVKHSSTQDFENHKKQVESVQARGGVRGDSWKNSSDLSGANDVHEGGRWPANMILTHHPECRLVGTKDIKKNGSGLVKGTEKSTSGNDVTMGAFKERLPFEAYGEGTTERMANWQCHECCPIARLDAQSGDRPSTLTGRADPNVSHAHPGTEFNPNSTFLGERSHHSNVYADDGGASRFFQQFPSELKEPFFYIAKANRMEASLGEFKVLHPTLKPVRLMAYLIKLVTPVGGLVLDPYCGSGSTCHAALVEGYSYIGIEKDPEVYEEATRRMKIVHDYVENEQHGLDLFDLAMSMEWVE